MKVLILDQFSGVSPYWLQQEQPTFDALVDYVMTDPDQQRAWIKPRVEDVAEDYSPDWATTVLRAREDGLAEIWKCKWDSSG